MQDDILLEVKNVYAAYGKADVLEDVNVSIRRGTITCLLGSNGSGKSTLIRAILGLTPARAGGVYYRGEEITTLATHRIVGRGIACIPEGRKIFPKLTVEENLVLGGYQVQDKRVIRSRMDNVFDIFPRLQERRTQLAGTMSGGEQAMVSIGRSLMSEPELLLIDEPSLGLSPLFVKENFKVIEAINQRGVTVFLVEQNVHQTLAISHFGYVLSKGRVVAEGEAEVLLRSQDVQEAYFG